MRTRLSITLAIAFATSAPEQVDVFVAGTGGYHTYRIPSVIRTRRGTLLAFCEGRKGGRGDAGDLDLVMKRSSDGGERLDGGDLHLHLNRLKVRKHFRAFGQRGERGVFAHGVEAIPQREHGGVAMRRVNSRLRAPFEHLDQRAIGSATDNRRTVGDQALAPQNRQVVADAGQEAVLAAGLRTITSDDKVAHWLKCHGHARLRNWVVAVFVRQRRRRGVPCV